MPVARNPYSGWAALLYKQLATRGYDPADITNHGLPSEFGALPADDSTPPPSILGTNNYGPPQPPSTPTPPPPGGWQANASAKTYPDPGPGMAPGGWLANATKGMPPGNNWQSNAGGQTWQQNAKGNSNSVNWQDNAKKDKKISGGLGSTPAVGKSGPTSTHGKGGPTGWSLSGFSTRMNPRGGGWSPAMSSFLGNLALSNYASGGGWGSGGHALTMRAL